MKGFVIAVGLALGASALCAVGARAGVVAPGVVFSVTPEANAAAKKVLRDLPIVAFQAGEHLTYDLHYGLVSAGVAELEVRKKTTLGGHKVMHIVAKGRSISSFDWVFKVRDTYESYFDMEHSLPWLFLRDVNEGGYKINQNVRFNHYADRATSNTATVNTPENVQDLVSAFYAARNMNLGWMVDGDHFTMPVFLDDTIYNMKMRYAGRETVKTDAGTFKCKVYYPQLLAGRVFKDEDDMKIWVTDDDNRIPVQVSAEILIGTIAMSITEYKGLRHPLTSKVK